MDDLFKALPQLLRAAGESHEVSEAAAFVAWRRAAGEAMRGCAVPFRLYNKTLVVAVPDVTWRKQLEKVSPQLIFRVNSMLGQALVTYVEFRVDPETVGRERALARRSQYDRLVEEENALRRATELDDAADAIHDEDLRRRFLLAAGSCMNRRSRQ
jgi:hypothetical protein